MGLITNLLFLLPPLRGCVSVASDVTRESYY